MMTATTVDKEAFTRGSRFTGDQDRIHPNARAHATEDQQGSGRSTVKLTWEGLGSQIVKRVLGEGSWTGLSGVMYVFIATNLSAQDPLAPLRCPEPPSNCG